MNLYRGCTHGCIYCDSRSTCYQMKHGFEDVHVKKDALSILEKQLRSRKHPTMISTGAMCDHYMPMEEELQLMRQCLELFERYEFGVTVLTKSTLVLRDLDLFYSINATSKSVVQMTLTTADPKLTSILEPHVSNTEERFETLCTFKKAEIPTVVWLGPILPFINDTEENLHQILDYCFEAGVKGILCFGFGTTMRDGSRDYFYSKLEEHLPGMKEQYEKRFGLMYDCKSPHARKLWRIFTKRCQKHGVMCDPNQVLRYLRTYERKDRQMTLFDYV